MRSLIRNWARSRTKVGVVYGHVASNFGDVAITEGVIRLFRRYVREENLHMVFQPPKLAAAKALATLLGRHPWLSHSVWESGVKSHGSAYGALDSLNCERFVAEVVGSRRVLAESGLEDCDVVVFNSGEHLFSYGKPLDDLSLVDRLLPILVAAEAGKRIICLPSTFGPFVSSFSKSLFRWFARACEFSSVRDLRSRGYLAEALDIVEPEVPCYPDPAFFLFEGMDIDKWQSSDDLVSVCVRLDQTGLRVGSSQSKVRSEEYLQTRFEDSQSFQTYGHLIDDLLQRSDVKIQLLIQTIADKRVTRALYDRAVAAHGDAAAQRVRIRRPGSLHGYIRCIYESRAVVSSRFHAVIFAYAMGRPAVGIYFDEHGHKMPGLFSMFGQERYCFKVPVAAPAELTQKVEELLKVAPEEGRRIRGRVDRMDREFRRRLRPFLRTRWRRSQVRTRALRDLLEQEA